MSNDEYLEMLGEQNQQRKQREVTSKVFQDRKKLDEREKGFNVYMQGANQVKHQPVAVGQKNQEQRGARRQWRDSSKSNERQSLSRSPINTFGQKKMEQPAYHNPFDLQQQSFGDKTNPDALTNAFRNQNEGQKSPITPSLNVPAASRKKWGNKEARELIEVPVDDDDDYSDDDFEQIDNKALQIIKESTNELDSSAFIHQEIDPGASSAHIQQFLKTATAQEMDIIRESLSNFHDVSKNFSNLASGRKKQPDNEDDYIEEEFEEDIPEDNEDGDSSSDKEELKFEVIKKSYQKSTAKGRPVSAVYDLAKLKTETGHSTQRTLIGAPSQKILPSNQMHAPSTVKKDTSSKYSSGANAMKNEVSQYKSHTGFQTNRNESAIGNLQPNKSILTANPFTRPFSEVNKRKGPKTTFNNTNVSQKFQNLSQMKPDTKYDTQIQLTTRDDIEQSYGGQSLNSKFSQKEQELSYLMQIISVLDDTQRQDLMKVLESKNPPGSQLSQYSQSLGGGYPAYQSTSNMSTKKGPDILVNSASATLRARNELRIKVISTHGDPHMCGLTEIELFDQNAKKVVILPTNITIKNNSGAQMQTKALCNGEKFTNEHRSMWIGRLPLPQNPPISLEIIIFFALTIDLSAVKLWNYNKSMRDGTKGIRDIELYINDDLKFSGTVKMAKGSTTIDYSQLITFRDNVKIKDEIQPIQEVKNEDTIDHSNVSFQQPALFKQEASDYKPDYVQNQPRARNIDIIRQNTKNQMSRSRSPIDTGKPVWLQSKESKLLNNASSRSIIGNDSKSPISKLNKRQTEQMIKDTPATDNHNKFKTIFGEEDESIQWPKAEEKKKTNNIADDIFKAVNVVNAAVQNQERSQSKSDRKQDLITESLDSMDFFKVTNLGRINEVGPQSQLRQSKQRSKWGSKIVTEEKQSETIVSDNSQLSAKDASQRSVRRGPKLMKSTFPEEFCLPSPSIRKSISKVSTKKPDPHVQEEDDLLADLEINVLPKTKPSHQDAFELELKQFESINAPTSIHTEKTQDQILIDKLAIFKQPFVIPQLPSGKTIEFNILQTWGDINYIGMTGIEMFDSDGNQISTNQITANPSDINLLMGQGTDPRTVDKLLDGTYFTNDDFHAWLTPFTKGDDHTITIQLPERKTISMIRLWNYNKSRIHSFRGARLITCHLDGKMIFKGEISKAPGNTLDPCQCCEIILFTDDESIMTAIDKNDWINSIEVPDDETTDEFDQQSENRPMTATKKFTQDEIDQLQQALKPPTTMFDERPQTKAIRREPALQMQQDHFDVTDNQPNYELDDFKPVVKKKQTNKTGGMKGRNIELNITESWGDLFYVGLNGIQIYDINQEKISIDISNIDANPRDMNSIPGHGSDHRTLDKLVNGINNTDDDRNMWLIPFNVGEDHTININLGRIVKIGSIRIYNYNKSLEDTLRGVKLLTIKIDGKLATPAKGITIRKAPGFILPYDENMCNDIGQTIFVPFADGWKTNMILPIQRQNKGFSDILQEYEAVNMPIGFNIRINLYSTHGDNYYIGLNGIELFDQLGNIITVNTLEQVMVNPSGINRIPGMDNDVRTIDKLFNGKNDTFNDQNMWLAPFKFTRSHAAANSQEQESDKREPNFISVFFDKPIALGAIKIWNYAKTTTRGVHEFEIVVDDKPVYRGFAKKAPESEHEQQKSMQRDFSTVVLFSSELAERFKNQVQFDPTKEQDVLMFNEKKQMNQVQQRPNEKFVFNENDRPQTKYGKF